MQTATDMQTTTETALSPAQDNRVEQMLAAAEALYTSDRAAGAARPLPLKLGRRPELSAEHEAEYEESIAYNWGEAGEGPRVSRRRQQSLRAALVFVQQLLMSTGMHQRLREAGMTLKLEEALLAGFEYECVEVQQTIMLGELYEPQIMSKLIRGRLAAMLMAADSAQEWWLLSRALKTMPDWVLGGAAAEDIERQVLRRDREADSHPELDYPASDPQAAERIAQNHTPMNRADRRRIDAMLRKQGQGKG